MNSPYRIWEGGKRQATRIYFVVNSLPSDVKVYWELRPGKHWQRYIECRSAADMEKAEKAVDAIPGSRPEHSELNALLEAKLKKNREAVERAERQAANR